MHAVLYVGARTLERASPEEEREERTPVASCGHDGLKEFNLVHWRFR